MMSMAVESSFFSFYNQAEEYFHRHLKIISKRFILEETITERESRKDTLGPASRILMACRCDGFMNIPSREIEEKFVRSIMVLEELFSSTNILVVGRRGVGKSTLINTLVGGTTAMDYAKLETPKLIKWFQGKDRGTRYGEIPDLSISPTRTEAAEELRKCLTERGNHKLVFVCELESGRVHADDVTTIKVVLDAINDETFPYSIVFNKMTRQMRPETEKWLVASLTSGHKPPAEVFCFLYDVQLENGDTAILAPNKDFQNFIERQQSGRIQLDKLNSFNLRAFDSFEHFQNDESYDHFANFRNMIDLLSTSSLFYWRQFEQLQSEIDHLCNTVHSQYSVNNTTKIVVKGLVMLFHKINDEVVRIHLRRIFQGLRDRLPVAECFKQGVWMAVEELRKNQCVLTVWRWKGHGDGNIPLYGRQMRKFVALTEKFFNPMRCDVYHKHSDSPVVNDVIDGKLNIKANIAPSLEFGYPTSMTNQCTSSSKQPVITKVQMACMDDHSFFIEGMSNASTFRSDNIQRLRAINATQNNFTQCPCIQCRITFSLESKRMIDTVNERAISVKLHNNEGAVMGKQEFFGYYLCGRDGGGKTDGEGKHDVHIWVNIPLPYIQENIAANHGQVNISIDLASILQNFETA